MSDINKTFGKNGTPELPAVQERPRVGDPVGVVVSRGRLLFGIIREADQTGFIADAEDSGSYSRCWSNLGSTWVPAPKPVDDTQVRAAAFASRATENPIAEIERLRGENAALRDEAKRMQRIIRQTIADLKDIGE